MLMSVKPAHLANVGRLRTVRSRLEDPAETFEAADAEPEWLVELDALVRRRPTEARSA